MYFSLQVLGPRLNTRTPDPRGIKFTVLKGALSLIIPITLVYLPNTQDQKRTFLKIQCIFTLLLLEPHPSVITSDHWVINFLCWPVNFLTETDYSSGRNIRTYSLLNPFKEEFEAGPNTNQELFWTPAR